MFVVSRYAVWKGEPHGATEVTYSHHGRRGDHGGLELRRLEPSDIKSERRHKCMATPRAVAM
jgi:hypothetical protein